MKTLQLLSFLINNTKNLGKLLIFGFVLLFASNLFATEDSSRPPQVSPAVTSITVAMDDNYPPYIFRDSTGALSGYLVDIWQLWEKKTGVHVNLIATDWKKAQDLFASGQANVIDTIFKTQKREAYLDFTAPYANIPVNIYTHQSIGGITDAKSLKGFLIGVKAGDACIENLKNQGISTLIEFPSYESLVSAAIDKQMKIFCLDEPPANYLLYRDNAEGLFNQSFTLYSGQLHRAVHKGDAATFLLINQGFSNISKKEELAIYDKWMGHPFAISYGNYLKYALFISLLISLVVITWSLTLRHKVKQRTSQLESERTRLRTLLQTIPDMIWLKDIHGIYQACNLSFERFFKVKETEIIGKRDADFLDQVTAQTFAAGSEKVTLSQQTTISEENINFDNDLGNVYLETIRTPLYDSANDIVGVLGVSRDITKHIQSEQRILRFSNLYKALSEVNQAIVRMDVQADLFPLVCRCAVKYGGMTLSWIGQLDENSGAIKNISSFGDETGYLDTIAVSSRHDVPEGRGVTGTALRENHSVIVNDYLNDTRTEQWHESASQLGWASAAAFPILRGGKPFAVLTVCHSQANAFDSEVSALLEEMSKDISFALDNFDREVKRMAAEASLKLAASVFEASSEAIMITDADNLIISVNPAFVATTGYLPDEVIGKNPRMFKSDKHNEDFHREFWRTLIDTGSWQGEIWDKRKSGEVFPKWLTINSVYNVDGSLQQRFAMFTDISHKIEAQNMIWHQANYDFLTGLPNRQMFYNRLNIEIENARQTAGLLAILFIDIDRFKEINDTLGHDAGDLVIIEAATRLKDCVRDTDTVARLGGDEFTIILSKLVDPLHIQKILQKILTSLSEPYQLHSQAVHTSVSIGVTLYPNDATTVEGLLKNADQAMYDAKNKGRNCFSFFTSTMQDAAQNRMQIANDLRNALPKQEFWIAYQPIVELSTGLIYKAEALIRWQHPTHGLISPIDFIPIAEDTGLIVGIGEWIFKQAAQQAKQWRNQLHPEFQISVNKSPVQFRLMHEGHQSWYHYLEELGIPGNSLSIEITEGLLLEASDLVKTTLLEFRDAGMQVSIDDFGTGYSALSYLKKFDIDYLKIDKSFVANINNSSDDLALCEAIIVMAHKLNIKVIAEGVETDEQYRLLSQIGCDYGQGYLWSKPTKAPDFEVFFEQYTQKKPNC
jgi:diguanylate cyclase (GGDEF)-like protein/PAS domain S-box-containing protein